MYVIEKILKRAREIGSKFDCQHCTWFPQDRKHPWTKYQDNFWSILVVTPFPLFILSPPPTLHKQKETDGNCSFVQPMFLVWLKNVWMFSLIAGSYFLFFLKEGQRGPEWYLVPLRFQCLYRSLCCESAVAQRGGVKNRACKGIVLAAVCMLRF